MKLIAPKEKETKYEGCVWYEKQYRKYDRQWL